MLNKVAGGLLVLAVLGYVAGIAIGNVFVYMACFLVLASAILFSLLVLIMNITWKLLSEDFKKTYEIKRSSRLEEDKQEIKASILANIQKIIMPIVFELELEVRGPQLLCDTATAEPPRYRLVISDADIQKS